MLNKIDVRPIEELSDENQAILKEFQETEGVKFFKTSNKTKAGIMDMRNEACDKLLLQRVETKLRGRKTENILNRINVAVPAKRDEIDRPAHIPDNAPILRALADLRPKIQTERDIELALDDEYILDLRKTWDLKNAEEAQDIVPEIWEGKNIADFVDPDIMEKLAALEAEEEAREESGFYKVNELDMDDDDLEIHDMAKVIRRKRKINKLSDRSENKAIGRSQLIRKGRDDLENKMTDLGIGKHLSEGAGHYKEAVDRGRQVNRKKMRLNTDEVLEVGDERVGPDGELTRSKSRNRSQSHLRSQTREKSGVRKGDIAKSKKLTRGHQKPLNQNARVGEADRRFMDLKPKHLFSGKRTNGTHDRR